MSQTITTKIFKCLNPTLQLFKILTPQFSKSLTPILQKGPTNFNPNNRVYTDPQ